MDRRDKLAEMLKEYDERYDSKLCLLGECCKQRGYHTNIKNGTWVHSAERSLMYAVALMDTGEYSRAADTAAAVVKLQETDKDSGYFGIWPYFYEEPVSEMSPPDPNSADFCSKMLLQLLIDYSDVLVEDLKESITNAVKNACCAIMRRDVEIQYTNVVLMDTYVTVIAGELFGDVTLLEFGKNKLTRFWAYTQSMGGLNEYNSPNYNLLVARDIALFMRQVRDAEIKGILEEINDFVWRGIAEHFFVPLNEWTAPNARRYEDFLTEAQLSEVEAAARGDESDIIGLFAMRDRLECPVKYRKSFFEPQEKYIQRINSYGYMYPYFAFAQVNTTYMTKRYALGSYNRSEMWNQIRPLQMFFGDADNKKSLRLRVLHDCYDFSSGLLHCVQYRNKILGSIGFSTDRGDTHISIDTLKDGRFKASELAAVFEVTGDISYEAKENRFYIHDESCNILIDVFDAGFGGENAEMRITHDGDKIVFAVVLYSGEEKEISLTETEEAFCGFYMEVYESVPSLYNIEATKRDSRLTALVQTEGVELKIENSICPELFSVSTMLDKQYINGERIEDISR